MKSINLGLYGSDGKMGEMIRQSLPENIVPFVSVGSKIAPEFKMSAKNLKDIPKSVLDDVDVWIDFSAPEGLRALLKFLSKQKVPLISGTTGLTAADFTALKNRGRKSATFWASNMSIGLWALRQALKSLSAINHFDFEIDEIHHTQKKDNPSGTAITLQKDLEQAVGKKIKTPYGKRIGGVFGVHRITAGSDSELLTFEHTALNRRVFAQGALKAAAWIVKQRSGFYSMDDLMK